MAGSSNADAGVLDVVMITGLDISSSCPSAFRLPEVPFKLSSKIECTN
jgi:hypothetical protein